MDKTQANSSIKNLTSELFSLNPSALITMFEINIEDIGFGQGIISETEIALGKDTIFKFHNTINLTSNSIFWQNKEYIAAPIQAEGFEMNVKGSTPTPKLSLTVSDEGIPHLARLKDRINSLGDIVGAKITRIRTFAKFLDAANFVAGIPPQNFFPDPNSELPRDIYYIDRKSNENKNVIEFELSPIYDLEGIRLPGRIVNQSACSFSYRGSGCGYEFNSRRNQDIHEDMNLPAAAPPIASINDEHVTTIITGCAYTNKGEYNLNQVYSKGDYIFIQNRGLKYYFISKINVNATQPPSPQEWLADECSKRLNGCKLRFSNIGDGSLPWGAFASVNRFR